MRPAQRCRVFAALLIALLAFEVRADAEISVSEIAGKLARKIEIAIRTSSRQGKTRIVVVELENQCEKARALQLGTKITQILLEELKLSKNIVVLNPDIAKTGLAVLGLKTGSAVISTTAVRELGTRLGAQVILCGSVTEVGAYFDVSVRLVDVETASILSSEMVEFRQETITPAQSLSQIDAQKALLGIAVAIQNYAMVEGKYEFLLPGKLEDLVLDYLSRLPDPLDGKWLYDPKTGQVSHSRYPKMTSEDLTHDVKTVLDIQEHAARMNKWSIHLAIQHYYQYYGAYPKTLADIEDFKQVPTAYVGKWIYDPATGKIDHSIYSGLPEYPRKYSRPVHQDDPSLWEKTKNKIRSWFRWE